MAKHDKMTQAVNIPAVGESVSEGTIASWLVTDGQMIEEGQALLELETDKATLEIPAPASGIVNIEVAAGSEVVIDQQVASIVSNSGDGKAIAKPSTAATEEKGDTPVSARNSESTTDSDSSVRSASTIAGDSRPLSPAVKRIVAEHNADTANIIGSGRGGRITKGDVLSTLQPQNNIPAFTQDAKPRDRNQKPAAAHTAKPMADGQQHTDDTEAQHSVPLSRIRKRIAENLVQSKLQAAHLTTFNEIDMTEVMQLRSMYREEFEKAHGIRLGFMSFFVKASCLAIKQFPTVNAFLESDTVIYNNHCHIGVALASDKGLIVPVLRDAEQKNFADIETEIKDFALAAKEKRLSPDSLHGGTFTITNGGVFGSLLSTPIPNPPQTAILGMHTIKQRPAVVEGEVMPRPLMYIALTYDHRLIDGKEAVGFLTSIKQSIEEPARLMLAL